MKKKNSFLFVLIAVFMLITGCFFIIKGQESDTHSVILPALDKARAEGMVKEAECYIVWLHEYEDFGAPFCYEENGQQKPIFLIARDPRYELSYIFEEPGRNKFLVKGYRHEGISEDAGMMVFYVEDWYLIEPIKRDYGPKDYRVNQRTAYPERYLDSYDLEQRDYLPIKQFDLTISGLEAEYYLKQDGYYKIRSRWNEDKLEWFLVEEQIDFQQNIDDTARYFTDASGNTVKETKISLTGNLPEYLLHPTILNNSYEEEERYHYFIVNGRFGDAQDRKHELEIYKWWIAIPIPRHDAAVIGSGSEFGFNRLDIEAGVYKNYR